MICVSIAEPDFDKCLALVKQYDFVEIRLDAGQFTSDQVHQLFSLGGMTIATFRPGRINDNNRQQLLLAAIQSGAAMIDVETESDKNYRSAILKAAHNVNCRVIISYHNFDRTPDSKTLSTILHNCYAQGAEIAKIACQVNNKNDILDLMSLYGQPGNKTIIGMGDMGRICRVLSLYLGAEFTFASPDEGNETAPGQISNESLQAILKLINQPHS